MEIRRCAHCGEKSSGKLCSSCSTAALRQEMCRENGKIRHAAGLRDLVCGLCGSQYVLAGFKSPIKSKEVDPKIINIPETGVQEAEWVLPPLE